MHTNRTQNSILHYIIQAELSFHFNTRSLGNFAVEMQAHDIFEDFPTLEASGAWCLVWVTAVCRATEDTEYWCVMRGVAASLAPPAPTPPPPSYQWQEIRASNKPLQRFHNLLKFSKRPDVAVLWVFSGDTIACSCSMNASSAPSKALKVRP